MAKRMDRLREQGRRKRGRSSLRWDDRVRSAINQVGVFREWKALADDRWKWRSIMVKDGEMLGPHLNLTPYKWTRQKPKNKSDKLPYLFNLHLLNTWFLWKMINATGMTHRLVVTIWKIHCTIFTKLRRPYSMNGCQLLLKSRERLQV